ncbi:hypothetical protein [Streptomyces sp. NBC_01508]|uniref:hypothetical protein n=1 Tax=Streptomyces sp. NBC_01508 TaxID=2903888 RepID=UPI003863B63F
MDERVAQGNLAEPADRLTELRRLGDELRDISRDAGILALLEKEPDFSRLEITVSEPQIIGPGEYRSLELPVDVKILYVVRDGDTREILKVGETTSGRPLVARFDRYQRAADRLGKRVESEVRIPRSNPFPEEAD